jgi:hypothetical protein
VYLNEVSWSSELCYDTGDDICNVLPAIPTCTRDRIKTVSIPLSCHIDGQPSCDALFRCAAPIELPSAMCRLHFNKALQWLKSNQNDKWTEMDIANLTPFAPADWQFPTEDAGKAQLAMLRHRTDEANRQHCLLIDTEFGRISGAAASIFEVAIKAYGEKDAIIHTTIHYPGEELGSDTLTKDHTSFVSKASFHSTYNSTKTHGQTVATIQKTPHDAGITKSKSCALSWWSTTDIDFLDQFLCHDIRIICLYIDWKPDDARGYTAPNLFVDF